MKVAVREAVEKAVVLEKAEADLWFLLRLEKIRWFIFMGLANF
jgi:hypothetical protein